MKGNKEGGKLHTSKIKAPFLGPRSPVQKSKLKS